MHSKGLVQRWTSKTHRKLLLRSMVCATLAGFMAAAGLGIMTVFPGKAVSELRWHSRAAHWQADALTLAAAGQWLFATGGPVISVPTNGLPSTTTGLSGTNLGPFRPTV